MYDPAKSSNSPMSQPEHLSIAMQFANEMLDRYDAYQGNEMLELIKRRWSEHRLMEIEKAEKHVAYLKDSLSSLSI